MGTIEIESLKFICVSFIMKKIIIFILITINLAFTLELHSLLDGLYKIFNKNYVHTISINSLKQ